MDERGKVERIKMSFNSNLNVLFPLFIIFIFLSGCIFSAPDEEDTPKLKVSRQANYQIEGYLNQSETWNYTYNITEDMHPWNIELSLRWSDEGWIGWNYDHPDIFELELIIRCINHTVLINETNSTGDIDFIWGNSSLTGIEQVEIRVICHDAGDVYNIAGTEVIHVDEGNSYTFKFKMIYDLYIDEDEATEMDLLHGRR